jgi:hypothetical protein
MNSMTRAIDRLGTRNRNWNTVMIGSDAAKYGARCVTTGLLFAILGIAWTVAFVGAVATKNTALATASSVLLLLFGCPLVWLSFRYSAVAARLAADHAEPQLGFRPRWWWCYSSPRGWTSAIERQKRWHARGQWPLIPW